MKICYWRQNAPVLGKVSELSHLAVSYQLSAISHQPSAISYQLSAICQLKTED